MNDAEARALLERGMETLSAHESVAAVVAYDLHAIRSGWGTVGRYDLATWFRVRDLLEPFTPEDLVAVLGEPVRPS